MTSDTAPRPVSPLRARMIEDMTVRGFNEHTRSGYVRHVRAFAAFIGRSPGTATAEDLRLFQLHQTRIGMQPPSINSAVSALRFFFTVTLDRPDLSRRLTVVPQPRRIPAVLSVEEVRLLLRAATTPKYKAAFATAYGAGLRVSEVVALKVGDIDSERMLLRVERGKGRRDRHAMLSPQLLKLLRAWWREGRRRSLLLPRGWLFPGRDPLDGRHPFPDPDPGQGPNRDEPPRSGLQSEANDHDLRGRTADRRDQDLIASLKPHPLVRLGPRGGKTLRLYRHPRRVFPPGVIGASTSPTWAE